MALVRVPSWVRFSQRTTSRLGSGYGSGLRRTAFRMLKIAVLAPMPRASVKRAAPEKPGFFRSERSTYRRSASRDMLNDTRAERRPLPHARIERREFRPHRQSTQPAGDSLVLAPLRCKQISEVDQRFAEGRHLGNGPVVRLDGGFRLVRFLLE